MLTLVVAGAPLRWGTTYLVTSGFRHRPTHSG